MNVKIFVCFLVVVIIFSLGFLGGSIAFKYHGVGVTRIAPTYALDKGCIEQNGAYYPCSSSFLEILNKNGQSKATDFSDFWQEATKNTQFTVDSNPVEITDVQVFYRTDSHCTFLDTGKGTILYDCKCYKNGNLTLYPSGIENSQTYVAPTPIICPTPSSSCPSRSCYDIITAPPCYIAPTPIPSCTIHIDTFDKFPPMEMPCPAPTPTPTPVFAFPYEFCANGCVICTDHLGNCTYIPGK